MTAVLRLDWQPVTRKPDALGESPFWHPDERCLYWVDIPARAARRLHADGRVESWPLHAEPGCIAPARPGFVLALRDGLWRAAHWGGPLQCITPAPYDTATTRFNDGKADRQGRLWAGTLYEPKDAPRAALYSFDLHSQPVEARQQVGDAVTANGLAWSPDARTMYWADTQAHRVWAWERDAAAQALGVRRVFFEAEPKPAGWQPGDPGYGGRPDGAAMDAEGCYWCAMYEGARLLRIAPDGTVLAEVPVPARCPTMPCFGGDDLRTLYVTTARHKRPDEELSEFPVTGLVLAARVDVPGLPVNFVSG